MLGATMNPFMGQKETITECVQYTFVQKHLSANNLRDHRAKPRDNVELCSQNLMLIYCFQCKSHKRVQNIWWSSEYPIFNYILTHLLINFSKLVIDE